MSGRLIAFWSPCTGSGVTTLAAHTAAALARSGPVAALDLHLDEPNLGLLADTVRMTGYGACCLDTLLPLLRGGRVTADELAGHLVEPGSCAGLRVLSGPAHPLTAAQVEEPDVQRLLDAALAAFPLMVADLGPALDSVATWPVLERADAVVWVLGTQYPSRYRTRRHLLIREQISLQRAILVCNFTRPLPVLQVIQELPAKPAVLIPHTPALLTQEERGHLRPPSRAFARAVQTLADMALQATEGRQQGCPASTC